jgi:glycosyltransferase involved in cell wall biosynthesis
MNHKWWKKQVAWWLYQRRDLKQAAAIHCTTELEVGWNKALGFNNCFIAPLGTRESSEFRVNSQLTTHNYTLLFVGRIYPVKGLVNLIKAWSLIEPRNTLNTRKWVLRIVGPDEAGHQASLQSLVSQLSLESSVEFPGPKFGAELTAEYENCDCLVLPSFTENFGATIVDALAHGKPVITSSFTPWKEVQDRGCGWWVSNEPVQLASAIGEMMSLDDSMRREMGAKGRKLVEEKYTWDAVAHTMINEYQKVISSCQ